jgi:hypothetical protein
MVCRYVKTMQFHGGYQIGGKGSSNSIGPPTYLVLTGEPIGNDTANIHVNRRVGHRSFSGGAS